ncbi:MAG: class I SAM-dependent methyltransferase [Henriciella sp.]|nr:class I SAM-dependent methyltransferase [Henriciella sp.]MBO6696566.1 class I SAM-dependent methyltransferase [Henriciella sp.]
MPDKAKFWDGTAEKYSKQPIANQKAYEIKLDLTREYFTPDSQVLEFGCGTGSTAILHAPFVKHIDAIDVSQEMIRIAKDKLEPAGVQNVTFRVADMDRFQATPESYDAVLGLNILHLLDDRMAAMREVYKALKPGGHFISSTACLREKLLFTLIDPLFPLMHALGQWPKVYRLSASRIQRDMEEIGFKTVHYWQPDNGIGVFMLGQKPE